MSLTGGTRAGITGGIALLASGLAMGASGAIRGNIAHSLGGTSLTIVASTLIALVVIRTWVVDTRQEKQDLADQRRAAAAQERQFFALKAANEAETGRLHRDMNAERARITKTLYVEREAMRVEFEKERLEVSKAAFRTGAEMERAGLLKPDEPTPPANLIQFPNQQPARERSREHGVVGP